MVPWRLLDAIPACTCPYRTRHKWREGAIGEDGEHVQPQRGDRGRRRVWGMMAGTESFATPRVKLDIAWAAAFSVDPLPLCLEMLLLLLGCLFC